MKVDRDAKDSDDAYLKKQLNLEAVVMDEAIKTELKTRWMDRVPTDWLESWWRQINIPAMPGKDMYRSANLLNYHTGYWGPMSASSESRARKETISAAISEYCTILDYRIPLLSQVDSPAAFIRYALENATSFAVNVEKGRQGPTSKLLTWPDSIEINAVAASSLSFDIVDENMRSLRIASRLRDQESIQKVINAVQSCPAAWVAQSDEEPSSQTKAQPVGPEVANILENLVKTLVKNAYEKRESIVVEDATMSDEDGEKADEEAAIPKEDRLKFMFRHMHFGHDDDESELGEEHHKVKDHATSISCLFSAFDNKARLRLLGQLVDDPSSKKTVTSG
ncbi:hypothetical protein JVT61DRAFT_6089 [Boletus reticuloceps]|uniref:Uncharacterized protein n=1 Tax=Boletus reticuloceps TaxID=495285 RepID=A0A8I2YLF7_9AGAM|nr:hypothetical protein JVT61DRAFT_6089 [Boletus reticuloceps]